MLLYLCVLVPLLQVGFSFIEEDADLSPLSLNYEAESFDENFESWGDKSDNDIIVFDTVSTTDLSKICKNSNAIIYVKQEDIVIDCKVFTGEQSSQVLEVVKRSAEAEEGSGDGSEATIDEQANIQVENTPTEAVEENKQEEATEFIDAAEEKQESANATEEEKPEETSLSAEVEQKPEETQTQETTVPDANQVLVTQSIPEETPAQDTIHEPEIPKENLPESTEIIVETEQSNADKEGQKVDPESPAPNDKSVQESEGPPKDEAANGQDGQMSEKQNTEVSKKGRTLIGKKEEATNGEAEVKESKESPQKASSKDTTILVFLFAAVVVVGAAAFGYNFVKKRRQQTIDAERVERDPAAKRSSHNLNNADSEPEQKPLIGEKKEVEMVNLKKNDPEIPNDEAVKT